MAPRIDILTQHAEEAAFLYARLRRSHRVLDGNARQTRSLLARIDAHLDALTLFARDARGAVKGPAEVREVGERFVAACLAAVTGEGLGSLAGAALDREGHVAVRDALRRYATAHAREAAEGWLAEGGEAAAAVAVELAAGWGDPRAEKLASRAVRRGKGVLRAAGVCALAAIGGAVEADVLTDVMRACEREPGWCDAALAATALAAPARALEFARSDERAGCDTAWVLLGASGEARDRALLLDALDAEGAVGAIPAALALAGEHRALDDAWAGAARLAASNALREAAYVVLGGDAPPVVVRDDMAEEPEDVAQRAVEDAALREAMRAAAEGAWRWGVTAADGRWGERVAALGPRHRGWGEAALRVVGVIPTGTPARA